MSEHEIAQRQALSTLNVRPPAGSLAALVQRAEAGSGMTCRLGDASCATAHASRISRAALGDGSMLHRSLRRLQRDYGNQFVGQVLRQATGGHDEGGINAVEADPVARHAMDRERAQRQPEVPKVTEEDEKKLGKKATEVARDEDEKKE